MPTCFIKRVETIEDGEPPNNYVYWRDGRRYIKDKSGTEHALLDIAPHLEQEHMMELLLKDENNIEIRCMHRSMPFKGNK